MSYSTRFVTCVLGFFLLTVAGVHASALRQPGCDGLAQWSKTIDANDRWEPFPENPRVWLPEAMASEAFAALFGKPALEWSEQDVLSARGHWNGCIQMARKARDDDRTATLSAARRYVTSNLRNAVRYQERQANSAAKMVRRDTQTAQSGVEKTPTGRSAAADGIPDRRRARPTSLERSVNALVSQPPSLESLLALGTLSRLDFANTARLNELQRKFGSMPGHPATRSAYQILREVQVRGPSGFSQSALPAINARLAEVKPPILASLREEFSKDPADLNQRRALASRYETVMADLEHALPDDEWRALADETRSNRRAIVAEALGFAKTEIDGVPAGPQAVATIDQIVNRTVARGLDGRQRRELTMHARARQTRLADDLLNQVIESELQKIPESWAGFAALDKLNARTVRAAGGQASAAASASYSQAVKGRMAQIGRKALPEFERQLATLTEDEDGLAKAERHVADVKVWHAMEESVRRDYLAAAEKRRDRIFAAVRQAGEERRAAATRERKQAIAAGADPRVVGYRWIDENEVMQLDFRDAETVFVTALGMKFAGTYKVSRDDVVVTGPHGQLVYTLRGDRLVGMGATFRKRTD